MNCSLYAVVLETLMCDSQCDSACRNEFLRERFAGEADLEERVARMSIIQPNQWNQDEILINMAYLALIHSSYVNGVAAIHSNIIKDELFKEFSEIFPEKFQNKTNGVTPRRCALQNP